MIGLLRRLESFEALVTETRLNMFQYAMLYSQEKVL
jgi:hypothetical protein